MKPPHSPLKALPLSLFVAMFLGSQVGFAAITPSSPGWRKVEVVATGSYYWRYLPESYDREHPAPAIFFFHGSGGRPEGYKPFVIAAAEASRAVIILPKSERDIGWESDVDDRTVAECLRLVGEEIELDPRRIAVAGHSAGGAYAILLAYTQVLKFSAAFSLASPFRLISEIADPDYKAPLRMYYGTTDPNYTGGAYGQLKAQWQQLGLPFQEEIRDGFGHSTWPDTTLPDGFRFLVAASYPQEPPPPPPACVPSATKACLRQGRFAIEARWRTAANPGGAALAIGGAPSDRSALFGFGAVDSFDLVVKVLDNCRRNQRFWVQLAAASDAEWEVNVTDTQANVTKTYRNPLGRVPQSVIDKRAFATCP